MSIYISLYQFIGLGITWSGYSFVIQLPLLCIEISTIGKGIHFFKPLKKIKED